MLRLLITLFIVSLISFYIGKLAPGDPAEIYTRNIIAGVEGNLSESDRIYRETRNFLGLNNPDFYFTITSKAFLDAGILMGNQEENTAVKKLIAQTGNAQTVLTFHKTLDALLTVSNTRETQKIIARAKTEYNVETIEYLLHAADISTDWKSDFDEMIHQKKKWTLYIPAFKWNGFNNQYHNWIVNPGLSFSDRQPVRQKIFKAMKWTLWMNGIALLLTYLISLPLGLLGGIYANSTFDKISSTLTLILFSLPTFWVATLFIVFFTTPEYQMDWFPTMGIGNLNGNEGILEMLSVRIKHLFLPVICLSYGSLAFLSRQMRRSTIAVMKQDYIRTAYAKGLSQYQTIWRHALPNAIFPILTLLGGILPALLAGSVAVEYIFNIPGMGKLTIDAILQRDWPVVFNILLLSSVLTILGVRISDFLYKIFDPRVKI
jgi:peptide/nickel transport system permease protein